MIAQPGSGKLHTTAASSLTPPALFKRVRAANVALPKRLRALNQLLLTLDQSCVSQDDVLLSSLLTSASGDCTHEHATGKELPAKDASVPTASAASPLSCMGISQLLLELSDLLQRQLLPRLARYGLYLRAINELTESQLIWLGQYFRRWLYPMLTPLAVDPGHPFPRLLPNTPYLLVTLGRTGVPSAATLQVTNASAWPTGVGQSHGLLQCATSGLNHPQSRPGSLRNERELYGLINIANPSAGLVPLQLPPESAQFSCVTESAEATQHAHSPEKMTATCGQSSGTTLLWREEIIKYFIASLFPGMHVTGVYQFRILSTNQRATQFVPPRQPTSTSTAAAPVESTLPTQRYPGPHNSFGSTGHCYLHVEQAMPTHLIQWLASHLHTSTDCVFHSPPILCTGNLEELAAYCRR